MKFVGLALAITLSVVLLGSVGPVVQASDNNTDNATVDLEVEVVPPPPVEEEVVIPLPTIETNLFDIEESLPISEEGEIQETIEATSGDGKLTITLPKGTTALGKDGNRLKSLEAVIDETPSDPPEDGQIIGLAYDFTPDGATFDPPITFTWSYDPDDIPEGVDEEDLVLAYYDGAEWVELDCVVDTENNTITASVKHFTTFAIIGVVTPPPPVLPAAFTLSSLSISPVEVNIGETVTISLLVANIGGRSGSRTVTLKINGVVEATKEVTVNAGFGKEVIFSVTREAGSYSVTVDGLNASFTVVAPEEEVVVEEEEVTLPEEEEIAPTNWPLIIGAIAGAVVVVGLLVFFLVIRRRAA